MYSSMRLSSDTFCAMASSRLSPAAPIRDRNDTTSRLRSSSCCALTSPGVLFPSPIDLFPDDSPMVPLWLLSTIAIVLAVERHADHVIDKDDIIELPVGRSVLYLAIYHSICHSEQSRRHFYRVQKDPVPPNFLQKRLIQAVSGHRPELNKAFTILNRMKRINIPEENVL